MKTQQVDKLHTILYEKHCIEELKQISRNNKVEYIKFLEDRFIENYTGITGQQLPKNYKDEFNYFLVERAVYSDRQIDAERSIGPIYFSNEPIDYIALKKMNEYIRKIADEVNPALNSSENINNSIDPIIMKWRGQKNVIIDIFKQLKNTIDPNTKKPILANSFPEIALFLKQSFDCFEDTKPSTIIRVLNNNEKPPKESKRINLKEK